MDRTKAMRRAVREAEASGAHEALGGIATFSGPGSEAAGG